MRKTICILLCAAFMLTLLSCKEQADTIREPASFYYRTPLSQYETARTVIAPETREIISCDKDIHKILDLYLSGPTSDSLRSPFPVNTTLVSVLQEDNKVIIVLSSEFSALTGYDLNIACACICLTIFHLTSYDDVSIRAGDSLLDGNVSVDLSRNDLLLSDESFIQEAS